MKELTPDLDHQVPTLPRMAIIKYEVPDDLHRQAKAAAAIKGITLKQYVIEALARSVAEDRSADGKG